MFPEKIPKLAQIFLDEELLADLIDFRQYWYRNKPLNWKTAIVVSLKTQIFICDVLWFKLLLNIQEAISPTEKPKYIAEGIDHSNEKQSLDLRESQLHSLKLQDKIFPVENDKKDEVLRLLSPEKYSSFTTI